MTTSDSRLPIYQRLRDDLTAKISAQQWRLGECIPTETALAQEYGAAVGTVRKAIDLLVAEGRLERFQGRGTFVKRASFNGSLFRFFRFQSTDGVKTVPDSRILEREIVEAPIAVAEALRLKSKARVIRLLRLRLIADEPMLVEEIWLPLQKFKALMNLKLEKIGNLLYPTYEEVCGQFILSASEILTVESASDLSSRQLNVQSGSPLVVIERIAFGYDEQPLEWRRSRGPAHHFRYQVDIR